MSQCLTVTTRTLRSWKRKAARGQSSCKRGRKKTAITFRELLAIAREWKKLGFTGSRPVIANMPNVRVKLIREVVAELKRRKRKRHRDHILAHRVVVKVKKPGALGVIDAAQMPDQDGGESIVYKDRGSIKIDVTAAENTATCAEDTLAVLEDLKASGRLPLVLGSDNGSPFVAKKVKDFMRKHMVIHLRSLPRVAQQNGSAEHAVGEMKSLINDGFSREEALQILNERRKRACLNWKTASDVDLKYFEPCTDEDREEFYNAAKAAIEAAMLGTKTAKEKRKSEREAIFQTLEQFALIERTRGHQCV